MTHEIETILKALRTKGSLRWDIAFIWGTIIVALFVLIRTPKISYGADNFCLRREIRRLGQYYRLETFLRELDLRRDPLVV